MSENIKEENNEITGGDETQESIVQENSIDNSGSSEIAEEVITNDDETSGVQENPTDNSPSSEITDEVITNEEETSGDQENPNSPNSGNGSLVVGILALVLFCVPVFGILLGLFSFIYCAVQIVKLNKKSKAIVGFILSIIGLILSIGATYYIYDQFIAKDEEVVEVVVVDKEFEKIKDNSLEVLDTLEDNLDEDLNLTVLINSQSFDVPSTTSSDDREEVVKPFTLIIDHLQDNLEDTPDRIEVKEKDGVYVVITGKGVYKFTKDTMGTYASEDGEVINEVKIVK